MSEHCCCIFNKNLNLSGVFHWLNRVVLNGPDNIDIKPTLKNAAKAKARHSSLPQCTGFNEGKMQVIPKVRNFETQTILNLVYTRCSSPL